MHFEKLHFKIWNLKIQGDNLAKGMPTRMYLMRYILENLLHEYLDPICSSAFVGPLELLKCDETLKWDEHQMPDTTRPYMDG